MQKFIAAIQALTVQHERGEISDSEFASRVVLASAKYKTKALHSTTDRALPSRMGHAKKVQRPLYVN